MKNMRVNSVPIGWAILREFSPIELSPPSDDCALVASSVDVDNLAIAVWAPGRHSDRWLVTRQRENVVFDLVDTVARAWRPMTVFVQALPGGILLGSSDCAWQPSGADRNAVVVGSDGELLREDTFGCGINDVLTTSSGEIWVGYGDEGVYGTSGWNHPGPEPVGQWGLVRFDANLHMQWEYSRDALGAMWSQFNVIDDCYALNVTDERVIAYTYSGWGVLEIKGDRATVWPSSIHGANDVLVNGSHCALIGGYEDETNRVVIGELDSLFIQKETGTLDLDRRPVRGPWPRFVARGNQLNRMIGRSWRRFQLVPALQGLSPTGD